MSKKAAIYAPSGAFYTGVYYCGSVIAISLFMRGGSLNRIKGINSHSSHGKNVITQHCSHRKNANVLRCRG